jgi:hypothetical protein
MLFVILSALLETGMNTPPDIQNQSKFIGAWKADVNSNEAVLIFTEKFYALTVYDLQTRKFISSQGGSWTGSQGGITLKVEFNTAKPEGIGKETPVKAALQAEALTLTIGDWTASWKRIDDGGPGKLAGAWLITGRMVGNEMQSITPGSRRTMKILSGTRFQWIAYNIETKEFFGTGGGTYTTEGGKYTEHIEFFSRDSSRVGMDLTFDFALESGAWRHKGVSSKGDPIDEIWTRRESLGL